MIVKRKKRKTSTNFK